MPQRIAIIDDERSVRSGLCNLLQSEGYTTEAFDSAEVFLSHPTILGEVALIVADVRLRGMTGIEMLDKLHLIASPCPPLFLSPVMRMTTCNATLLGRAPLLFCASPLMSRYCWRTFSTRSPPDNTCTRPPTGTINEKE